MEAYTLAPSAGGGGGGVNLWAEKAELEAYLGPPSASSGVDSRAYSLVRLSQLAQDPSMTSLDLYPPPGGPGALPSDSDILLRCGATQG